MKLKIRGNDIELNNQKIGRLFDITNFQKQELEELFDKANNYEDDVEKGFQDGKSENE